MPGNLWHKSDKIPNEIIAGIIYWLLMILVVGICVAGTGILAILIEIKVIELYKKKLLGCYYPTDDTDKCGCHHLFWRSN